ncbi:hypothetical protein [Spirulina sp. 06S082]|nr:hypothetical protein [Spirulina sp. 06S082]MEA5468137.1 hypothetical protein [Spirulina sp. 06S082]
MDGAIGGLEFLEIFVNLIFYTVLNQLVGQVAIALRQLGFWVV